MNKFFSLLLAGALWMGASVSGAQEITGAGATFPAPIYSKWAEAYQKATGVKMNYQSIGSSGGIRQIRAKTVTFGATDAPVSSADLDKDGQTSLLEAFLAGLPDETVVLPGHRYSEAPAAQLSDVRANNYVFKPRSKEQWMMMFGH